MKSLTSVTSNFLKVSICLIITIIPSLTYACYAPSKSSLEITSGSTDIFTMACSSSCVADVSATPQELTIATVNPPAAVIDQNAETFTVTAVAAGSTIIDINWSCPGYSGSYTVGVIVNAVVGLSSGPGAAGLTNAATVKDPISTFSGELSNQFAADLSLGGPMGLFFSRYYSSGMSSDGIATGTLGTNWRHNFDWLLDNTGTEVDILSANGALIEFSDNAGLWEQSGNVLTKYQLIEDGGTGEFTLLDVKSKRLYVFSAAGLLTSISDGPGNQHTLAYNGSNQITSVTDGVGRTLTFTNTGTKLTSITDGTRTVSFAYTADDLTSATSALGNVTTYAYAAGGLLTSYTKPEGNTPITQVYDGSNRVTSQTDGESNTTTLSFGGGNVTTITDPLAAVTTHTHTASGELSQIDDPNSNSVTIASDADGRRNSITDRLGGTSSYTYHGESGRLATSTEADASTTTNSYTSRVASGVTQYDLTGITHADGTTQSFAFDASGNLTSVTDQAGNTSTATFNGNGQPLTSTNSGGGVTTNTYNADGTLATTQDEAGNTTTAGYDALKRPNLVTFADTNTVQFTYDAENRPLTIIDENAGSTGLSYDSNGNLNSLVDPLSNISTFTYDGNDRLLTVTSPLAGVITNTYNQNGKLVTLTDPNGSTTSYGYDVLERLTSVTNPGGDEWGTTYNAEGIVTSTTDPLLNTSTFTSDNMGRVTQIVSPLGSIASVTYDDMGRIVTATDPLSQTSNYDRDDRGMISAISLPGGAISTSYARNSFGQMTSITDPGTNVWVRGFDNSGRLTASTDPLGREQTITYDNRNRPETITYPSGLGSVTMTYDGVGNLTGHSFSDGTTTSYSYDANNRQISGTGITRAYDDDGRMVSSNGIANTRDAGGRIATMTLAAGKAVTYAYDVNNRVTSVSDWSGGVTTFTYDAAGRLTATTRGNTKNGSYGYDNDSQLVTINEGSSSISLTRDASGQITAAIRSVPEVATASGLTDKTQTFDAASQISGATYDAVGRILTTGADTYTWNLASQLTSYTVGGVTATATYDGSSRRLSRAVGSGTRNYVWNEALGLPSVSIEKDGATDLKYYIHTPGGRLLYSIDATTNARNYYHYDEMGNTSFVTNDAGTVIGSYAYSPFGEVISSTGGLENPFTWQGQYGAMDEGNGLYYLRARYYDSNKGRFINRDQIKSTTPREINPYQYAVNNPFLFIDPTGKDIEKTVSVENDAFFTFFTTEDLTEGEVKTTLARLKRSYEIILQENRIGNVDEEKRRRNIRSLSTYRREIDKYQGLLEEFEETAEEPSKEEIKIREKLMKKLKKAENELKGVTENPLRFNEEKIEELKEKIRNIKMKLNPNTGIESVVPRLKEIVVLC